MTGLLEALRPVIVLVLGVLIDLIRRRAQPTAEDSRPDPDLRDKLRAKVRKHWMILAFVLPILICGCGVRTIYVPHGIPVRLRETVKDVKVWVKDADGKPVAGRMDIPNGWYALPVDATD